MVSLTFYTTMTYLLTNKIEKREVKAILWFINIIIIFLIGFSRVYLGVHWPSDVLMGGFAIGLVFTYIYIRLIDIIK